MFALYFQRRQPFQPLNDPLFSLFTSTQLSIFLAVVISFRVGAGNFHVNIFLHYL